MGRKALTKIEVAAEVVAATQRARTTANGLIAGLHDKSGPSVLTLFKQKHSILCGLDKRWGVEFAFLDSHVGEKGETRLKDVILSALPSKKDAPADVSLTRERVERVGKSPLLQFCGSGLAAVFETVASWVEAIRSERAPRLGGAVSPFLASVQERLGFLFRHNGVGGKAGPGAVSYGREAIALYYNDVESLVRGSSKEMCMAQAHAASGLRVPPHRCGDREG